MLDGIDNDVDGTTDEAGETGPVTVSYIVEDDTPVAQVQNHHLHGDPAACLRAENDDIHASHTGDHLKMKNYLKSIRSPLNNEQGSVIVAAIFILVIVTILGIAASNTSTLELQIASNDQFVKMAFYNCGQRRLGDFQTDLAMRSTASTKVEAGTGNEAPGIAYISSVSDPAEEFYRQITGYDVYVSTDDIDFNPGGIDARADARRVRQEHVAGGGAEFATGSEGVGPSAIAIYYDVNTGGFSNRQTTSNLTAAYRKMVGIPGGL
jgi:hypothetical protein